VVRPVRQLVVRRQRQRRQRLEPLDPMTALRRGLGVALAGGGGAVSFRHADRVVARNFFEMGVAHASMEAARSRVLLINNIGMDSCKVAGFFFATLNCASPCLHDP
jgi:hypothetical protein